MIIRINKAPLMFALFTLLFVFTQCTDNGPAYPKPKILSAEPSKGIIGDPVIINGENLQNISKITFNGVPSLISQNSSDKLTTVVPPTAATGINKVAVNNAGGKSNELDFEVMQLPVITCPAPPTLQKAIPAANYIDFPVLIYGDNLCGLVEITFNDKEAFVYTNNNKVITTHVPKNLPTGVVQIKIRTTKGTSTIDFQVQGPPPAGANPVSFSIVNIPPPNYVPTISNNWSCGFFSQRDDNAFVDINTDDGNENFNVEGRYEYSFDKVKNYNALNYVEFTNKETGETFAGHFSSQKENPCILNMVLISSKTGTISTCTFNRRKDDPDLVCNE